MQFQYFGSARAQKYVVAKANQGRNVQWASCSIKIWYISSYAEKFQLASVQKSQFIFSTDYIARRQHRAITIAAK